MLRNTSKTSLSHPRGPQSHTSNSTRTAQLERHIQYLSSTLPNSQLNLLDTTIYKACPGSGKLENFWNHFIFVLFKENNFCVYTLWLNSSWHLATLSARCILVFIGAQFVHGLLSLLVEQWQSLVPVYSLRGVTSSLVKPKLRLCPINVAERRGE